MLLILCVLKKPDLDFGFYKRFYKPPMFFAQFFKLIFTSTFYVVDVGLEKAALETGERGAQDGRTHDSQQKLPLTNPIMLLHNSWLIKAPLFPSSCV